MTRDVYRSLRATSEIQAGAVWGNDYIPIISEMPHGGYKGSGHGKDMSQYVMEEYTQVKHVMYDGTGATKKALAPHPPWRVRGRALTPKTGITQKLRRADFNADLRPQEVKNHEYRVAITPIGVHA